MSWSGLLMSYKGYSFNLHEKNDKDLIDWLSNKKVTQTIKVALRNQMKSEDGSTTNDSSIELLSAIKNAIANNSINNEQPIIIKKQDATFEQSDNETSLSSEDAEDFEKIFDI
jgi:hypothetical protein